MNYNKLHRKLVGYNCSIFWVEVKMRLPCTRGWVVRHKVMENQHRSEIEIVEELMRELSGCQIVITADALHCQKKTLALIIDGGNDYIVTLKKNQSSLFKTAQELVKSTNAIDSLQASEQL